MRTTVRKTGGLALLASVSMLATAAAAAETDPATVEEVVVTAQFREQNLQQTPLSITAVSAQTLEARGQISVVDIANQAPNVTLKPAPGNFGPALQAFIRGVGQYDFSFALEPGVGMYVDDVYFSTLTGSIFDLLDLDRVEVLRGPQGTLAGQNSIGGAIKLYSKKPTGDNSGYLEARYGSYDRTEIRGSADFTILPDQLFGRIAGVSHHQDGYVDRLDYRCTHPTATDVPSQVTGPKCKLGTEGGKSYDAVRGSLRWAPTERLEVNLSADYTHDTSESTPLTLLFVGTSIPSAPYAALPGTGPGINTVTIPPPFAARPPGGQVNQSIGGIPLGTATGSAFITHSPYGNWAQDTYTHSPYVTYSNYISTRPVDGSAAWAAPAISHLKSWGYSGQVDFKLTEHAALKYIGAYREYDSTWGLDQDASPISFAQQVNIVHHWQRSHELRLTGVLADRVDYTVGGFYFDQKSGYDGRIELPGFAFLEHDTIPASSKAVFANFDWRLTDDLRVITGARYTKMEKTFYFGRLGVPGNTYPTGVSPQVGPLNGTSGKYSGDRKDYRIAVQYQWTPEIMTFAQVATGFKGGGVNPRPFNLPQELPFGPETLTAYEVGVKADLLDNRLRVNASAFLSKYNDILVTVTNCPIAGSPFPPAPCALPVNAGKADIKGIEVEFVARPVEGLQLDGSYSTLDFEYTSLSAQALSSGLTKSMRGPFTPKVRAAFGAQYQISLGDLGTLTPRLDYSRQSGLHTAAISSVYNYMPGYHVLNGRLSWRNDAGDWEAALEVQNITDELYYTGIFDNRGSTRAVMGVPALPRTYAVSLKKSF
jgi:iron complex outermembrane receptor protein